MRERRHTLGGLILAIMLTGCAAFADVWPSWLSPASGSFERGNQALSGAVERLTVVAGPDAWTSYCSTNIFASYFSQYAKLAATKAMLKAAIEADVYFTPTNAYPLDSGSNWTTAALASHVGAPSTWWTNTPHFNLAMDSNGWMFIPAIESNMHVTVDVGFPADSMDYAGYDGLGHGATFSEALADVSYSYFSGHAISYLFSAGRWSPSFMALSLTKFLVVEKSIKDAAIPFDADCSVFARVTNDVGVASLHTDWDGWGWNQVTNFAEVSITNLITYGNTNLTWDTTAIEANENQFVEWIVEKRLIYRDWSFTTNGFKWFR